MTRRFFLGFSVLLFAVTSTFAQSSSWAIDKSHSQADFVIRHLAISNVRGAISGITGTIVWDEKNPANCSVEASLDAKTVNTNEENRDKHLRSAEFFNVDKFPTLTFKSTSVERMGGKLKIVGNLTLAGVTKAVTLSVDGPSTPVKGQDGKLLTGFSATGTLKRSDFEFGSKYGPPVLGDDISFTLDLQASKVM